ncbi:MAG: choice-of-anchor D domain-containing protein [Myxococcaceae bacterium]|nr:choice-of-anchor D domain-containing protein [Myxococcaceae bacterium]
MFELETAGSRPSESLVGVELFATAEARDCFVPPVLDFGEVPVSLAVELPLTLDNATGERATATRSDVTGRDPAFFSVDQPVTLELEPNAQVSARVRFAPAAELTYEAELRVRRRASCAAGTVRLVGRGSSTSLTWSPAMLDFGRIPVGEAVTRSVTVVNRSGVDLPVTLGVTGEGLSTQQPSARVTARSSLTIDVQCRPPRLGLLSGTLALELGTSPALPARVPLRCVGGGPRLRVSPSPLAFGLVPFFTSTPNQPTPTQPSVSRRLRIENVGSPQMNPADTSSNLVLGRNGQLPLLSLTPRGATGAAEFSVAVVRPPTGGIPATLGRNFIDLDVSIMPSGVGPREATLTIYSNDALEPVKTVPLVATGIASERCTVVASVSALAFGDVPPDGTVTRTFTLTNTSTAPCTVSGLDLAPGSAQGFVYAGPAANVIGPGQQLTLSVSFDAKGLETGATAEGLFRFTAAGQAPGLVFLSARVTRCLVIVPEELDFGTIKLGCASDDRPVQVFNTCGANVTLLSATTAAPFTVPPSTRPPQGGVTIAPATSVTVLVSYTPPGVGANTGTLELRSREGADERTLAVSLKGIGDLTGVTVETYQQPAQPVGDVLFTIDDSCSMADEQAALAMNFGSFIRYAMSANLDYHIAVTTTDDFRTTAQGRFVGPSGATVLTNAMPSVAMLFAQRVLVGTSGNGVERPLSTTLKALSPPLISGANGGFLRDDANLAIIIVSDAADQSPEAIGYYLTRLPLVKGPRRRHQVSVSVIGPFSAPSPTCIVEGQDTTGRYDSLISATGGVRQTICKSNWATDLEQLGRSALGPRQTFFVRNPPDTTQPVDVLVNGQAVSSAWTYDAASNAIVFADGQAPGAGTTVTVSYQSVCRQ